MLKNSLHRESRKINESLFKDSSLSVVKRRGGGGSSRKPEPTTAIYTSTNSRISGPQEKGETIPHPNEFRICKVIL